MYTNAKHAFANSLLVSNKTLDKLPDNVGYLVAYNIKLI